MAQAADIERTVVDFLSRLEKLPDGFGGQTSLYAEDGAGIDSLETAELSALLEDEFGSDPYAGAEMPETLDEILAFFETAPASA